MDIDAAVVGVDDCFDLEHADADAAFLGGFERAEKAGGDESGSHSRSVIANGQGYMAVLLTVEILTFPVPGGIRSVEDQVSDDFLELIGSAEDRSEWW